MDEFNNLEKKENIEASTEAVNQQTEEAEKPLNEDPTVAQDVFVPPYNPINFTQVTELEQTKPIGKGLKFFCLIMAAVIVLTAACLTGYFIGRGSTGGSLVGDKVNIGLAAKPADTDELTAAQVYEKTNQSVVGISVYNSKGVGAQASGVVYSKDGYIITNDHIYSEVSAAKFKIYTYDGKEYDAVYVAGDKISDLAVLKVEKGELTAAQFGNSDQLIYGENVVAIGRPDGAENPSSITKGIISATERRVQTTSNYSSRLIQTDSSINPGSSGGALVNMYGQVIGITSSKLASVEYDTVGYAIPTTIMKSIVEELIEKGNVVSRAKLGITYTAIDTIAAEVGGYEYVGLYVASVAEDSDLYGKLDKGDIITHINGTEVTSDEIVLDIIDKSKAGDTVKVTFVSSKGDSKTVDAVLKANVGESSYTQIESNNNNSNGNSSGNNGGGTFDFPFGE